jgi:phenylalanyl-tRNA synthetase beta chain
MLFLKSWLEDYIDLQSLNDADLADIITRQSSEVDEILSISDWFEGKVLVGRIESIKDHPNADKLKILSVKVGCTEDSTSGEKTESWPSSTIQILTAAPNPRLGMYLPVATIGCKLPHFTIQERKIRGELSQGMGLGKSELLLEDGTSWGLWDLEQDFPNRNWSDLVGKSICQVLPDLFPTETVFDIKVLPDKIGAIGSHLGMALEIATCLKDTSRLKSIAKLLVNPEQAKATLWAKLSTLPTSQIEAKFEDPDGFANSFMLLDVVADLSKFPAKITKRLWLSGRHLVGGLTDVSNYLLADLGQPNHFFSRSKVLTLGQNKINWKIAQTQTETKFEGLGQLKQTTLPAGLETLQTESGRIIHIPGISGGAETKTEPEEEQILVEIANFNHDQIARNSFAINYRSEGSKVWIGGVQTALTWVCLYRLINLSLIKSVSLIFSYSSGNPIFNQFSELKPYFDQTLAQKPIKFNLSRLASKLDSRGLSFWSEKILDAVQQLGRVELDVQSEHKVDYLFYPNPFYNWVKIEEDLLTQVLRSVGFETLMAENLPYSDLLYHDKTHNILQNLKKLVTEFGYVELITRPFVGADDLLQFPTQQALTLLNPYNSLKPYLRPSLIPSLLQATDQNLKQGQKNLRMVEFGQIYFTDQTKTIQKKQMMTCVSLGDDPYDLTSLLHDLARKSTAEITFAEFQEDNLGQKLSFQLHQKEKVLARGELYHINNKTKRAYDLPLNKKVWILDLDITHFDVLINFYGQYTDESEYPTIKRSYSLQTEINLLWSNVESTLQKVQIDGVYTFVQPLERLTKDDFHILNFKVEFVSYHRTLQSEEISQWEQEFLRNLQSYGPVEFRV